MNSEIKPLADHSSSAPIESFYSIFEAARDLRNVLESKLLPGSGIESLDDADVLLTLLSIESNQEEGVKADGEQYVLLKELQQRLVREQAGFSRSLTQLSNQQGQRKPFVHTRSGVDPV